MRIERVFIVVGLAAALLAPSAWGLSPADKCESSELKTSGKYGFCRLKANAKAVKLGGAPDFSKCDATFSTKFGQADTQGMGQCPSSADEATLQAFITQCTDDVATALGGGPLPNCSGDLATCNGNLSSCNGSLTTCSGNLGTCNTNLSTCTSSLATVTAGTAAQADVLSGKTFSSGSGLGLAGTMPNNRAQIITPGTANQTIAAGYHNGAGYCAGDPDLVASNCRG